MYIPCADCENDKSTFHWRTVACSLKCAMEYFEKIDESRKPKNQSVEVLITTSVEKNDDVKTTMDTVNSENIRPIGTRNRKKKNNEESEQID